MGYEIQKILTAILLVVLVFFGIGVISDHLFKTEEILGYRIATQHNLNFYIQIMNIMRKKIIEGTFIEWSNNFFIRYSKSS